MSVKKKCYIILITLFLIMLVLPFVSLNIAPTGCGMGLFILLFFLVNPLAVIAVNIIAGTAVKQLWWTPIVSAGVFPFFFGIADWNFGWDMFVYSAIYLPIGLMSMLGTYLGVRLAKKNSSD